MTFPNNAADMHGLYHIEFMVNLPTVFGLGEFGLLAPPSCGSEVKASMGDSDVIANTELWGRCDFLRTEKSNVAEQLDLRGLVIRFGIVESGEIASSSSSSMITEMKIR